MSAAQRIPFKLDPECLYIKTDTCLSKLEVRDVASGGKTRSTQRPESSDPTSQFFSANKSSRLLGCGGPFCRCWALAAAHVKSFASKHLRFLTSSKAHDQHNRTERGVILRRFRLECHLPIVRLQVTTVVQHRKPSNIWNKRGTPVWTEEKAALNAHLQRSHRGKNNKIHSAKSKSRRASWQSDTISMSRSCRRDDGSRREKVTR